ncbi:MAG TPA: hypothetical protein VGS61_07750 [Acidimicrobiales bacterium]|nr:hypothetical protein [Acidimicrobiales bacterium]
MTDEVRPPLTTTTSIMPAMVVLIIAVVTLGAFLVINLITGSTVKPSTGSTPIIVGGLATAPGDLLAGCRQPDNPPGNIASALRVPATTAVTSPATVSNAGAGDFTCAAGLRTDATAGRILGYYKAQLEVLGWALFSSAPSHGHSQLLFQKAGSDTFYWVLGVTVERASASSTRWTLTVYQNSSSI